MSHAVILTFTLICGIAAPTLERRPGRCSLRWAIFQAIWWTGFSLWNLFGRVMDYAVVDVISAALWAHLAWELWRRNRKPRASRALGRVVNLGHRLGVRPEPVRVTR
jgi:hypothetical protein